MKTKKFQKQICDKITDLLFVYIAQNHMFVPKGVGILRPSTLIRKKSLQSIVIIYSINHIAVNHKKKNVCICLKQAVLSIWGSVQEGHLRGSAPRGPGQLQRSSQQLLLHQLRLYDRLEKIKPHDFWVSAWHKRYGRLWNKVEEDSYRLMRPKHTITTMKACDGSIVLWGRYWRPWKACGGGR